MYDRKIDGFKIRMVENKLLFFVDIGKAFDSMNHDIYYLDEMIFDMLSDAKQRT